MGRMEHDTLFCNLADLYINYQVSGTGQVMNINYDTPVEAHWCSHRCMWVKSIVDFAPVNELYSHIKDIRNRCEDWQYNRDRMRRRAIENMWSRLAGNTAYRNFANKTCNPPLYTTRASYNKAVKAAIKLYGMPSRDNQIRAYNVLHDIYAYLRRAWCQNAFYIDPYIAVRRMCNDDPALYEAITTHNGRIGNRWRRVVWENEPWFTNSIHYYTHFLHISEKDPSLVAYTQNGAKMVADIQTPIKPGKYLAQFFGDVLTGEQIRHWANEQVQACKPQELKIVPNTDPDGWEWVYEHGHGFASCMVFNHPSNRYLNRALHGDLHPVRAYAHPKNDLALAWIGHGYMEDGGKVFARTIVNTKRMTYLRVFGDDRIHNALRAAGYSSCSSTTDRQILKLREFDDKIVVPYLDGNQDKVDRDYIDGEDVLVICKDGEYDGCNSCGYVDVDGCRATCGECGERCDEDDMTYIEGEDINVCDSCRCDNFVYAYGRRGEGWYRNDDCIYCRSDSEYYVEEYTSYHDIYQCVYSDDWYRLDALVSTSRGYVYQGSATALDYEDGEGNSYAYPGDECELPDGTYCHVDDYDRIMAEDFSEDEDEDEPVVPVEMAVEPCRIAA